MLNCTAFIAAHKILSQDAFSLLTDRTLCPYKGVIDNGLMAHSTRGMKMRKLTAPFLIKGAWQWHTWPTAESNHQAAIIAKAAELGATAWDYGQATFTGH